MKNWKKTALTIGSYAAVAALAVGGTIAYMTASVSDDNLMVAGKGVEIELLEQQRTGVDGELVDFEDGKVLMPISDGQGQKDKWGMPVIDGYVDKIVRVSNTGENDAYVRVFVAIPSQLEGTAATENILHWNYGNRFDATGSSTYNAMDVNDTVSLYNAEVKQADIAQNFIIDGIEYNIYSFTYLDALEAGDTTDYATLTGCYLDADVDYQNGDYVINGETLAYDLSQGVVIPVFAQGVQTTSFADAEAAFAASGLAANPWAKTDGSAATTSVTRVANVTELSDAIAEGGDIILTEDIALSEKLTISADTDATLYLNGNTLSYVNETAAASSALDNKGTLTLKGGTITYEGVGDANFGYGTNTINNMGKLIVDGTNIINTTDSGSSNAIDNAPGSELIVNSGVIESEKVTIRLRDNSTATINGGEISGARAVQIHLFQNIDADTNLTINGGTLTGEYALYSYAYGNCTSDHANITINGGTFNGIVAFGGGNKTTIENVTINGGTFNGDLGRYLANDGWEDIAKP